MEVKIDKIIKLFDEVDNSKPGVSSWTRGIGATCCLYN